MIRAVLWLGLAVAGAMAICLLVVYLAPAPPVASASCCDEVLRGAGRCSHAKHTLMRSDDDDGLLWVCICDAYR